MKKILIDLNVLLDFLNKRPFHREAARIIGLCESGHFEGCLCAHEVTTLAYFLLKELRDRPLVERTLSIIMDLFTILPVDAEILRAALSSPIRDYEDAVVEASAMHHALDAIITRNMADFAQSRIMSMTPEQFLLNYAPQM